MTRGAWKGIEVRGSQELTAVKEMAAKHGLGNGKQHQHLHQCRRTVGCGLGQRVIQGASQYLSTKFRTASGL